MPFSLVMLEVDGTISWYNTRFLDMIDEEDILNKKIDELVPKLKVEHILKANNKAPLDIKYKDKYYKVYYNIVDNKKNP